MASRSARSNEATLVRSIAASLVDAVPDCSHVRGCFKCSRWFVTATKLKKFPAGFGLYICTECLRAMVATDVSSLIIDSISHN